MNNSQLSYYLAGLIEGDGNIYIPKYSKSLNKYNYNPKIEIAFHRKELPFIEKLKNILGTGSIYLRKTKAYFDKYPLLTSKYLDYLCFLEGLNYLGKRLNNKEIFEIQNIQKTMNNNRTYYNWDHLNNMYF